MSKPVKVMVVCGKNACRSQMAEGLLRWRGGDRLSVWSAGIEAGGLDPRAVRVMGEIGVDISGHSSDQIDPGLLADMEYVITVCSEADKVCPMVPPSVTRLRWPVDDPAAAEGSREEVLMVFCRVRDELDELIQAWIKDLRQLVSSRV